jgi:CDP-glucose 4,6-dehydratase
VEYPLGQRLRELPGPLLLTGHTGFKGTWMTFLLEHLKIPVVGYSLAAEKDSLYDRAKRAGAIPEQLSDIRDYEELERFIDLHKPSTIIHMAAQPLVLKSYEYPRETFEVNVMGTVNVLDIAFKKDFVRAIVIVTTDKVYRNDNTGRAFVETDPLEGKDPYSASKVGTESVVTAWQQISKVSGGPNIISTRAGNVIGGGDFAKDRIIPDLVRGAITGKTVEIRNPESTRPWQHVLDPCVGYLLALEALLVEKFSLTINFGPNEPSLSVAECVQICFDTFSRSELTLNFNFNNPKVEDVKIEALSLNLNISQANQILNWEPTWNQSKAIENTVLWWSDLIDGESAESLTLGNISNYLRESKLFLGKGKYV